MIKNNRKGIIAKVAIIIGVIIIPLLYSFFYLQAFWDPYARLTDVDVAVVNLDKGAVINGENRNLGEEICDNLKEDGTLGVVFTNEADADDGLLQQKYYATITIPADFSENVSSIDSDSEKIHSAIIYKANQKKNYLASQILENAMPTIKQSVNSSIDKEIISTLCEKLNSVPDEMGELQDGFDKLQNGSQELSDGSNLLNTGAGDLSNGAYDLVDGANQIANGTFDLKKGMKDLDAGIGTLKDSAPTLAKGVKDLNKGASDVNSGADAVAGGASSVADGAKDLKNGIKAYTKGVADASDGSAALVTGLKTYTSGVEDASKGASTLYNGIVKVSSGVDTMAASVNASISTLGATASDENLAALNGGIESITQAIGAIKGFMNAYEQTGDEQYLQKAQYYLGLLDDTTLQTVSGGVSSLTDGMKSVKEQTAQLAQGLQTVQAAFGSEETADTLIYGANALNLGLAELAKNNDTINGGMTALDAGLSTLAKNNEDLNTGASSLATGAKTLSNGASTLAKGTSDLAKGTKKLNKNIPTLTSGINALKDGSKQLVDGSTDLNNGAKVLATGSGQLYDGTLTLLQGTDDLADGIKQLSDGIDTASTGVDDSVDDMNEKLNALDGLADYGEEPVTYETEYVQPVANYGSAFAPYFMGLSLWVGGLMIFFGIYLDYKKKIYSLSKDGKNLPIKFLSFGGISIAQGVCLALVIKYALGIAVNNMGLLCFACILTSLTFMVIIQFFIIHTGNIGKFLALFILILQLTSSAGTFPIETQSKFFIVISKYLPMTYSTQLFKEAISGTCGSWAMHNALVLVVFLVIFAAITIIAGLISKHLEKDKPEQIVAGDALTA